MENKGNSKPVYKTIWFWVLITFAILIFLVGTIGSLELSKVESNNSNVLNNEENVLQNIDESNNISINQVKEDLGLNGYGIVMMIFVCIFCSCIFIGVRVASPKKHTKKIDKILLEKYKFNITKSVGDYIYLDEKNQRWAIPNVSFWGNLKSIRIHKYSDIVNFELLEDGNSIITGGTGKALAGGLLFGRVGAIVGGTTANKAVQSVCSNFRVKITLNNLKIPVEYITLIKTMNVQKNTGLYKSYFKIAQEIISILEVICKNNDKDIVSNMSNKENNSSADEILKFKQLLDQGIITQEEFDKKKQELLK